MMFVVQKMTLLYMTERNCPFKKAISTKKPQEITIYLLVYDIEYRKQYKISTNPALTMSFKCDWHFSMNSLWAPTSRSINATVQVPGPLKVGMR